MRRVLMSFLTITALGIVLYWTTVFLGLFPVEELVPGYREWFFSFPLPDFWIAFACGISAVQLHRKKKSAALWGIIAGSSMLFLSLYAGSYGFVTGLIYMQTIDEYIEIAIKIYTFTVGILFMVQFWRQAVSENDSPPHVTS